MPEIKVPAALTGGSASETVDIQGSTVRETLDRHAEEYGPGLRDSVVENEEIKEFVNVYVDGEEVGHLDGLDTAVDEDTQIRVVPAASGGGEHDGFALTPGRREYFPPCRGSQIGSPVVSIASRRPSSTAKRSFRRISSQ